MSDTFVTSIKIVELSTGEMPPVGYVGLYARDGNLYQMDASGVEKLLANVSQQFFVQTGSTPTVTSGANDLDYFVQYQVVGDVVTPYIWEPD